MFLPQLINLRWCFSPLDVGAPILPAVAVGPGPAPAATTVTGDALHHHANPEPRGPSTLNSGV